MSEERKPTHRKAREPSPEVAEMIHTYVNAKRDHGESDEKIAWDLAKWVVEGFTFVPPKLGTVWGMRIRPLTSTLLEGTLDGMAEAARADTPNTPNGQVLCDAGEHMLEIIEARRDMIRQAAGVGMSVGGGDYTGVGAVLMGLFTGGSLRAGDFKSPEARGLLRGGEPGMAAIKELHDKAADEIRQRVRGRGFSEHTGVLALDYMMWGLRPYVELDPWVKRKNGELLRSVAEVYQNFSNPSRGMLMRAKAGLDDLIQKTSRGYPKVSCCC